jgi:hypothetical protein
MKEIEPALLFSLLFVVLAFSSTLTLVGSWLVIWRYQRSVARAMSASGFASAPAEQAPAIASSAQVQPAGVPARAPLTSSDSDLRFRRALSAPWIAAACSAAGGLAYALVLAAAYVLAFPQARTPTRFALTLWIDLWPVVIAAAFSAPHFARWSANGAAIYFAPFVLGTLALLVAPMPQAASAGGGLLALYEPVTPLTMVFFWLMFAGVPSAVLLLFLNPRLRAVSPLLLAFSMLVTLGFVAFWFALYTEPVKASIIGLGGFIASRARALAFFVTIAVAGLAVAGALAWLALGGLKRVYLAKAISDRSIGLDALWLFFASYFTMQFALQGQAWLLTGVLAFAAYRITLAGARAWARRRDPPLAPRGLTFLRVFGLGPKSNALFDALATHWRRIGSMQLITGPDVAHSTVQPHQLLDFLAGRLARHFIGDAQTLEARLDLLDRAPDRDGWYRVNNFFCRADAWQAVLARLVREGDVVLMDLRSFSARNAGCIHELRHLVDFVPLGRCVFIVDGSTDRAYLRTVLQDAWPSLGAASPNRRTTPDAVELHAFDAGAPALHALLRRLCAAS